MRFQGEKLKATNRHGQYVRVYTFDVSANAEGDVIIAAQFSTGSQCAGLAMSQADARALYCELATILNPPGPALHATDNVAKAGQRRVTAICGDRVPVDRAVYTQQRALLEPLSCPGCRAIMIERLREYFSRPSMARS